MNIFSSNACALKSFDFREYDRNINRNGLNILHKVKSTLFFIGKSDAFKFFRNQGS